MAHSDILKLEQSLSKCDLSIKAFEDAIEQEQNTIKEYREMISDPNSSFPEESLQNGIDRCKNNIKTFEKVIADEMNLKKDIRFKISKIEEKEEIIKLQENSIQFDIETEEE